MNESAGAWDRDRDVGEPWGQDGGGPKPSLPHGNRSFLLQELGHEELFVAMEMLSAVVLINRALEAGDGDSCWSSLVNPTTGLAEVERENAHR